MEATVAPEVRSIANSGGTPPAPDCDPIAAAVERVENRIDAAWTTFERPSGEDGGSTADPAGTTPALPDPYLIPEAAVRAPLDREDG